MPKIILASSSERRRELLKSLGLKFEVIEPQVDEGLPSGIPLEEVPVVLAVKKAEAVFNSLKKKKGAVVIAADTLVLKDGELIGKPKDKKHAFEILKKLSGGPHTVITGLCILTGGKKLAKTVKTTVYFRRLTAKEIFSYIEKEKNVIDKAGAYGIQDFGKVLVERVEGDFYNVVGLPVIALVEMLREVGVNIL